MSEAPAGPPDPSPLLPPLLRARTAARAVMTAERLWPLCLPFLLVLLLALSFAWLGILRALPDAGRIAALGLAALLLVVSLYPLRFFRRPAPAEIDRRLEEANALPHTPVLAQSDRLAAAGDPFASALWREHQKRMRDRLANLRADAPRTGVAERDPWGLRAVVVLVFVAAFAFSLGPLGGRLSDAFQAPAVTEALPPRIDAWVTPPAYTGRAPVFLSEANASTLSVPENSEVSLRVTGGSGVETLSFTDNAGTRPVPQKAPEGDAAAAPDFDAAKPDTAKLEAPGPVQFAGKLTASGALVLADGPSEVRRWTFTVVPDAAPAVRWAAEPKRAANGALELAYEIQDDYGAASARSDFALAEPPPENARPLYPAPEMPLTLPRRNAKAPTSKAARDLSEHVWAGVPVSVTLRALDAAGQEGVSEPKTIVLPQRAFTNRLAKALIEQRRMLGLDAGARPAVLDLMDALALRPADTIANPAHFLGLETARTKLSLADTDDKLREVVDYLWQLALGIEEGDMSDAQQRLARAQEALKQALENGASDAEIERLMNELRQAMNEFMREFAEQAQKNQDFSQTPPNAQEMRPQDLDRMMDQLEEMAKSGNKDAAQELLSQLQQMMENLQMARPQEGEPGQQNSEMQEQMNKLGEIMRRQQEMMNETFRLEQEQQDQQGEGGEQQQGRNGEGQQGQGQQGQGQGGGQRPMTPEEFAQALKNLQEGQGRLQGELESLQKGLQGMGMQPGEGFGEAGREMGRAEGSLGRGEGNRAVGEQGRALEALRRGAQDMMQQMQQAMQGDQGGSQEGGRQRSSDRDPLGRPRATTGPDLGNSVEVPDEIDVQRARQILEAIRKRLGNALSPQLERDYLERLLELR